VTVCIAVSRAEIVGKFNTGRERDRVREETVDARFILDTSSRSRDTMIANRIEVFKFCLLNICKSEYGI
jgi:hypothetical protein